MNVDEAISGRFSCRAFLPTPVPRAVVEELLASAHRAPSGGNLQPWHVHAVTGSARDDLVARVRSKLFAHPRGEGSEYDIYPADLWEPYRSRRYKCGEDLYATIGVTREDKPGRLRQFARNYEFFGAPVGLFFYVDRRMGRPQWADVGMYMQNVMLLARARGLDTCAQEAWSVWHRTVDELLGVPPELMLFSGMALGHRDPDAPINRLRTERAAFGEYARVHGE
ncbi:MAG: nitroreductase [Steroidobacteraceae bacterium]